MREEVRTKLKIDLDYSNGAKPSTIEPLGKGQEGHDDVLELCK